MTLFGTLQASNQIPGDKSIGHRALIFSLLCPGTNRIINLPNNKDVGATQHCLEQLGVRFESILSSEQNKETLAHVPQELTVTKADGIPLELDAKNSGTTMRLLSGLLSALNVNAQLIGDAALSTRPMKRVIAPLREMNANITGMNNNTNAPINIKPNENGLNSINYTLPIASAQVKSALILAGLFAKSESKITEPLITRDHTERMLQFLNVPMNIQTNEKGQSITLPGSFKRNLPPVTWQVPGDVSSAAFFIVAALCIPDSNISLNNIGLNPQRIGIIDALQQLGADIKISNKKEVCGEPVGDITVKHSPLKGNLLINEHSSPALPALIDEIPILAVMACFLEGSLEVRGAEELRKKESDRIDAVVKEFAKLGIEMEDFPDGFKITGQSQRKIQAPKEPLFAHHDHRIAMALSILNTIASPKKWQENPWPLEGREWAQVSYPQFYDTLRSLIKEQSRP